MEITEVRVFLADEEDERLKAYATVTFDNCFVVRDLKVIYGNSGLFVAMPSKKRKDGSYKDIAHPIHSDFRQNLEQIVLSKYQDETKAIAAGIRPASTAKQRDDASFETTNTAVFHSVSGQEAGIGPAVALKK